MKTRTAINRPPEVPVLQKNPTPAFTNMGSLEPVLLWAGVCPSRLTQLPIVLSQFQVGSAMASLHRSPIEG